MRPSVKFFCSLIWSSVQAAPCCFTVFRDTTSHAPVREITEKPVATNYKYVPFGVTDMSICRSADFPICEKLSPVPRGYYGVPTARNWNGRISGSYLTPAATDALKWVRATLAVFSFLLTVQVAKSSPIEHPGVLHQHDNCSSCHANKVRGKSVHSALAISCTVCHLAETQGDMTTMNLLMPKEQICFACHEESTALRLHSRIAKRLCIDCHDAHSSRFRMLLKEQFVARPGVGILRSRVSGKRIDQRK